MAYELWQVDQALAELSGRQAWLQSRRGELLEVLRTGGPHPGPPHVGMPHVGMPHAGMPHVGMPHAGMPPYPGPPPPGTGPYPGMVGGSPAREVSPAAAKNVLLILGGLLLAVAAVVFTVVSWGRLGIGGRAAVLAGFTALVMLAPVLLTRRRLTATAETVAGFGVVLLLLDGYAARRAGFLGLDALDGLHYTAGVLGVTALVLVVHARVTGLRVPAPVAVVLAQPVLPLLFGELSGTLLVAMLVVTAAADAALVRCGRGAVRVTAAVCGGGVAALALLGGALYALGAPSAGEAVLRSAPLAVLALLGGFVTWLLVRAGRADGELWAAAVTVGTVLALIAVPAAWAQPVLWISGTDWRALGYLVPALAVVLAASWLPWPKVRSAAVATGGLVALGTVLTLLPRLLGALVSPLAWLDLFLTGTWGGAQWEPLARVTPADVVMLGAVAATLLAAAVRLKGGRSRAGTPDGAGRPGDGMPGGGRPTTAPSGGRRWAVGGALVFGALMVAVAPHAFGAPYSAAVAVQAVLAVAVTVAAAVSRVPWWAVTCAVVAVAASGRAAAYAFGSEPATLIVLPVLGMAAAGVAWAARVKGLRAWGFGFAVLFLGLAAVAAGFSLGLRVLVAMSVGFAAAGVLVLVRSLWAGRDRAIGLRYAGVALLVPASWLRLAADEVTVVEAYTVPCSLVLLGSAWLRRRGAPVSSWAAYGAGLSVTMVPSLVAVYADVEWRRSLALGVLALVVLLAGVRFRLQAPTVIGAVVVAGVAVRELGPYVSEMLLVVPRWAPIAVGGLLLVVIGATYEARMRDLRRLRDSLASMR
ncbi:hypothetical protein OUY22_02665 [Nonomuraea sp. MCN248]|uniref:DUF2157 domain-containing protein n=1 Tax=Nonomuraea corallina TaxID=2989783 RepID=A0ABT4S522_9ACTN|nr:hypothetical protein [Nonomuraea corallina]MDA0632302.1 hypothetical protein [Nonomuraea corallina]